MENKINPAEQEINAVISEIEKGLLKGQITSRFPQIALDYHTKLGAYLSMCYGFIERLDTLEAQHHVNKKTEDEKLSSLAIGKEWKISEEGIRQAFWENRIKRLKILSDTLEKIYYQGRSEFAQKEMK